MANVPRGAAGLLNELYDRIRHLKANASLSIIVNSVFLIMSETDQLKITKRNIYAMCH